MFSSAVFAATTTATATSATTSNWDSAASLKRVNTIGTKLMTSNSLPENITFKVSDDEEANAYANINKEVYIYRGLLEQVETDDELAAVISHEIGHIVNSHIARQTIVNTAVSNIPTSNSNEKVAVGVAVAKQLSVLKFSRNDEYEADLSGVDLMVKAGYNPLAMISVLNKICGNYFDIIQSHPSGEKRLMNIYDYTNYNYTSKIKAGCKTDSYQKALLLINANLEERNASAKKLAKAQKQQEKLKKQKIKRAKKMMSSTNPWDTSLVVIQALSSDSASE